MESETTYSCYSVSQAETELLAYFRGRVPEKKEMEILPDHAKAFDCLIEGRKEGYNQAIDEILKNKESLRLIEQKFRTKVNLVSNPASHIEDVRIS